MKSGCNAQIEKRNLQLSPQSFTCNKKHIVIIPASGYCEKNMHCLFLFSIFIFTNAVKSHVASNFIFLS